MSTERWEVWYPKAGATGLLLARGVADATPEMLLHSAPEVVRVEIRGQDGERIAIGEDLERTLVSPMCRLRRDGDSITREDIWPTDADLGATVLMPGGEVGILKQWWHFDDLMRWRWQVEFYNAIDSGVTTAPALGNEIEDADQSPTGKQPMTNEKRPVFMGGKQERTRSALRRHTMPANKGKHQHTVKAERMAEHIEDSAKKEGRYRGREERVAWATVHKELSKREAHRKQPSKRS